MNYEDRFKNTYYTIRRFEREQLMLDFINQNAISIVQIYTTYNPNTGTRFHLLYTLKEKVVI